VLLDRILDQILARIGAHVLIINGIHNSGPLGGSLSDLNAIDSAGNIFAAVTYKDTYANQDELLTAWCFLREKNYAGRYFQPA
jgi:hypothetical protein